ncbi:MAG: class I SAM-dependent methyltransferase [Sphingomicrobium sp.]|nr:class I SAM-dependent methyltransferase [Sphingomonadales bacterium]
MERAIFDQMAATDQTHWWYTARRRVLSAVIARKVRVPKGARILEIGCGTGHNVPMLRQFGVVDAVELDDDARAIASARLGMDVIGASLPGLEGVPKDRYDLVALLDVIEHVGQDVAGLASARDRLKPNGQLLITVPAHQWMWSSHDRLNHHFRRYSKSSLRTLIESAGLRVDHLGYFNSLLFPLAIVGRLVGKLTGKEDMDKVPAAPVNRLFDRLFGAEAYLVGRVPMPPGLSLIAIASTT